MARTGRWVTYGALLLLAATCPAAARAGPDGPAPLADDRAVIALAVALACAEPPAGAGADAEPAVAATASPAVEVVATVRARALSFDEVPRVEAVLAAVRRAKVAWRAERLNLPLRPRARVVYRDVEVRLTLSGSEEALRGVVGEAARAAGGIRLLSPEAGPLPAAAPSPDALRGTEEVRGRAAR